MRKYIEFGVSHMEVPGESCLCIYISGCDNNCTKGMTLWLRLECFSVEKT